MYKNFQKSTSNRSIKYSFLASFCIMAFLFTFITKPAYGATTTIVTNVCELSEPTGLAVDSSGDNIYVATDSVIKKIDISNNTTTTAAVGFSSPYGVALDSSGNNIYVADSGNSGIYKTDIHDGNTPTFVAQCSSPRGIALDSSGNIYVAASSDIEKFSSGGIMDENFNSNVDMNAPYGVAVDSSGNIYVEDLINNSYVIYKLYSDGNSITYNAENFPGSAPMQIAVDNSNNVYISNHDTANKKNIIYEMNTSGEIEIYASYDSDDPINGIAVDNDGNIYVTEGNFVKKITVSPAPELKIDTANPPNATIATPYSHTFTSTGGIGIKTYAVTDGSLPVGLTLSTDGILSGTPNSLGVSTFTIKVTDSATPIASTISATVKLTVIDANSSGGSSSGSSSDSTSTPVSDSTQFLATVTNGQSQYTGPPLSFGITTETDGTKKGKLVIEEAIAIKIVDSLNKQGGDTAIVMMPDPQGDLSSSTASIPNAAIVKFVNSGKNLELETPNGGVTLSNLNMKDYVNFSNQALYFTITPVNDAMAQTETDIRAVKQQIQQLQQLQQQLQLLQLPMNSTQQQQIQQQIQQLQQQLQQLSQSQPARPTNGIIDKTKERKSELQGLSIDHHIRVGSSLDIESNMPHRESVGIRIPMGFVTSPAQEAEIKKDSASYAIIADHSLGDIESLLINKISIKNMAAIAEANTNRFSRFTIIRLNQTTTSVGSWQNNEQGWKYINNGEPATGWNQIEGYWYLMDSDGIMQTGWNQTNGEWYYLCSDGAMESNTVIDGYPLGENGTLVE